MAAIRRHWRTLVWIQGLAVLLLAMSIPYLGRDRGTRATASPPAEPPVAALVSADAGVYSRLSHLRRELALGDFELAAMGGESATVSAVLGALVTWESSHRNALASADQTLVVAQRELQEANRRINVGPRDQGLIASLPALQEGVAGASAARQQILGDAVTTITGRLTGEQARIWALARSNRQLPERARFVSDLSGAQVEKLTRGGLKSAVEEDQLLTPGQAAQASAVRENVAAKLTAVSDLTAKLIPPPAEFAFHPAQDAPAPQ